MKRCSLCDGKLDREKRCTLCGLDNTKNDDQYKHLLNNNDCKHAPLTHIHEEPVREKTVKKASLEKKYSGNTYSSADYSKPKKAAKPIKKVNTQKNATSQKGVAKVIGVLVILLIVGSAFFQTVQEIGNQISEEEDYYAEHTYYDPYEYVEYELAEDGEIYQEYLEPGIYTVGVHIPEGNYQVLLMSGEYGSVRVNDSKNGIFLYESLYYEEQDVIEDIRLYDGGYFSVGNGITVGIYSENAQLSSMGGFENPLTESVVLTGEMIAGEDFPAGVYDVCYEAVDEYSYGSVYYTITGADGYDYEEYLHFDGELESEVYHNVTLPEGTVITADNLENVTLTPSEIIPSEDYDEFYELYW